MVGHIVSALRHSALVKDLEVTELQAVSRKW